MPLRFGQRCQQLIFPRVCNRRHRKSFFDGLCDIVHSELYCNGGECETWNRPAQILSGRDHSVAETKTCIRTLPRRCRRMTQAGRKRHAFNLDGKVWR